MRRLLEGYAGRCNDANGDSTGIAKIIREMTANEKVIDTFANGEQSARISPETRCSRLIQWRRSLSVTKARAARLTAWIGRIPEYAMNKNLTDKMIAADNSVDGLEQEVDAYFSAVEEVLKINRHRPPARDDDWEGEQLF